MTATQVQCQSIYHIIEHCGSLKSGEKALIVCDPTTEDLANVFFDQAKKISSQIKKLVIPTAKFHGTEPPSDVAEEMSKANLIMGVTTFSMAHTQARINATKNGGRYLSLPEYSWGLLEDPCVQFDFKSQAHVVRAVTDAFTNGKKLKVTTKLGTNITMEIEDRVGNYCPGFVDEQSKLGSPPDIESNVSPIEDASEGIVIVDGSITCPEIGLLKTPVELVVKQGKIVEFKSENKTYVDILNKMFASIGSDKAYVLAECGIGFNPLAKLQGIMLTDEGAADCVHFGFGSNYTVGGKNKVPFHLDFVFRDATVNIDGKNIIVDGKVVI